MATIEDVRNKAAQVDDALSTTKETAKQTATQAGIGVAVLLVVVFWLGRRRGRSKNTVIEVYRG